MFTLRDYDGWRGDLVFDVYKIIDVKDNLSFKTIYEAINYCAGTNYTGWMKAGWPCIFPENNIRIIQIGCTNNGM